VIGTDAFMAGQLRSLGIDREFNVHVYSAKTASLNSLREFLETYLRETVPVNRPVLSVFVLAASSIKEDAFKFFYDLGMSSREFRDSEWADIYGFDDGNMPRYQLRQAPHLDVPFYSLQKVHPLKIAPGTTHEEILSICRDHCKADKFLLIDHYQELPKHFLLMVVVACDAGKDTIFGYRIYNKTT
jgi:hypothetical protein